MNEPKSALSGAQGHKFEPKEILLELLGEEPSTRTVRQVGRRLAELIERDYPFTPSYIYNVISDPPRQDIGGPLEQALLAAWGAENGVRPDYATACVNVTVKALPGQIEEGAYILGESTRCANPKCMAPFYPRTWNHKYCCKSCREEDE